MLEALHRDEDERPLRRRASRRLRLAGLRLLRSRELQIRAEPRGVGMRPAQHGKSPPLRAEVKDLPIKRLDPATAWEGTPVAPTAAARNATGRAWRSARDLQVNHRARETTTGHDVCDR